MRHQISGDAKHPPGAERIETRLFHRIKQRHSIGIVRLLGTVNRCVVEAPLQHEAIGERAEAAVRGRGRFSEELLSALDARERASTSSDGAEGAGVVTVHSSGFSLLGSCSCSVLSSMFQVPSSGSGVQGSELRTEPEHEPSTEHPEG
jgi:hypothetical protein